MRVTLIDPTLPDEFTDDSGRVHPAGARIVPALADFGLVTLVRKGETIDVPALLAGRGPYWRRATDDELANAPLMDHMNVHHGDDDDPHAVTVEDLGYGLLAQVDVWARADVTTDEEG